MSANTIEAEPPQTHDRLGRPLVGPCLLWTKALDGKGYGAVGNRDFGTTAIQRTHRVAYALAHSMPLTEIRSVPELDHLCRVKHCCAPAHLEPVTHAENIARGDWQNPRKGVTSCIRGHEYTPENTSVSRAGFRSCRTCRNARSRRVYDAERRSQRYQAKKAGLTSAAGAP